MLDQKKICTSFIQEFLPRQNHRRKYSTNELSQIVKSLNSIFKTYSSVELSYEEVEECFEKLGYTFSDTKYDYNSDNKKYYMNQNGKIETKTLIKNEMKQLVYIDISPPQLRLLRRTIVSRMSPNTKAETIESIRKQKEILKSFFSKHMK